MDTKIQVEIFGQTYQIRAGADPEYIKTIARYVDLKMREIASGTPTVDSLKIAVLAALNITDEFFQLRRQKQDLDREVERRTGKLNEILDSIGVER
jgi:cell division protein ZapA